MGLKDMTVKEKVLRMVEKLPDDVTYDRVLYHVEVMQMLEERLEELERGEVALIPHEQVFAELSAEDAKDENPVDGSGKRRSAKSKTTHRSGSSSNSGKSRPANSKRSRKTKRTA